MAQLPYSVVHEINTDMGSQTMSFERAYAPSPDESLGLCEEIRSSWSDEQRERRRALQADEKRDQAVPFTIPELLDLRVGRK